MKPIDAIRTLANLVPAPHDFTVIRLDENSEFTQAVRVAIDALREKVERSRRYKVQVSLDKTKVGVYDEREGRWVGYLFDNNFSGNEAAHTIANTYEEQLKDRL